MCYSHFKYLDVVQIIVGFIIIIIIIIIIITFLTIVNKYKSSITNMFIIFYYILHCNVFRLF